MYGKLFESMYDGTLVEDWRALITFQQMIVLCNADGVIDVTTSALSRRTGIPLDIIEAGISILESPDKNSRTPDHEGRRLERLDDHRPWGWRIVNHKKYQMMIDAESKREADRVRIAAKRDAEKANKINDVAECRNLSQVSQNVADVAHTDTDTDTDTKKRGRFAPPTVEEIKSYCLERNNSVNPKRFHDFYESKGWMVGKNKMKDWKAAVRSWEQEDKKPTNQFLGAK